MIGVAHSKDKGGWTGRVLRLLEAQATGVVCALVASGLLGVGSFVMDRLPSRYLGLRWDDLRFFLQPPRPEHVWFYLLCAVLGVWGLSALVCTIQSVRSLLRRRVTRWSAYGAPVLHVCFVLAMLAHLHGGVTASSRQHLIGPAGTEIRGAVYQPLRIQQQSHPNGMPRQVTVTLARTRAGDAGTAAGADRQQLSLSYNEPIVLEGGATALLLQRAQAEQQAVVHFAGKRLALRPGEHRRVGEQTIVLEQLFDGPAFRVPVARITIAGAERTTRLVPLDPSGDGEEPAFIGFDTAPYVLVLERHNPSVPLVLLVSLLVVVGVVLVAVERIRRSRQGGSAAEPS